MCTATALMILMTGTFNITDGATNKDGSPHLIHDNGIYVESADGSKDVSGKQCMHKQDR